MYSPALTRTSAASRRKTLARLFESGAETLWGRKDAKGKKKEFFSITGQWLFSTYANEVAVSGWSKGVYVLRSEGRRVKVVVE